MNNQWRYEQEQKAKNPDQFFQNALLANSVGGVKEPDFGLFYFVATKSRQD